MKPIKAGQSLLPILKKRAEHPDLLKGLAEVTGPSRLPCSFGLATVMDEIRKHHKRPSALTGEHHGGEPWFRRVALMRSPLVLTSASANFFR